MADVRRAAKAGCVVPGSSSFSDITTHELYPLSEANRQNHDILYMTSEKMLSKLQSIGDFLHFITIL